jgi:hypothetical protein
MLADKELQEELNKFAKYVIQQSRSNLTKGSSDYGTYNDTKTLYNSLKGNVVPTKNGANLNIEMADYGKFKDKGVRGKSSSSKAPNSPFRFGSGTGRKGGLTEAMQSYVKRRRIQFKDRKTGRFLSYQSTAFLIARSIYQKGIKPSLFFTKPFVAAFKRLPDDLIKAYSIGLEKDLIKLTKR